MKRVVKRVVKGQNSPTSTKKPRGWRGDSWRHSLAAKGIKTKGVGRVTQDVEGYGKTRIPVKEEKKKRGGIRDVAYVSDKA